jgi:hypothetical protein
VGQSLDAAYQVLRERGEPLTAQAITKIALDSGYLRTKGKTPWQTMKSKLSTNILTKGDTSLFMRSGKAMFALREWKGDVAEHVADRFQSSLRRGYSCFPRRNPPALCSHYRPLLGRLR